MWGLDHPSDIGQQDYRRQCKTAVEQLLGKATVFAQTEVLLAPSGVPCTAMWNDTCCLLDLGKIRRCNARQGAEYIARPYPSPETSQ